MATLERGKGKRRQIIELVQFGHVLRMQETDSGDLRLPGYRRFPTDAAARAALVKEVRAHLDGGMQPADAEAREIARASPAKKDGPHALPVRQDIAIYNEATGFVVTSRKMAGKTLAEGSTAWKKAVTKGDMLPVTLIQDDPFILRVVAGEPLTAQEDAEWVARVDWHLNVPDGKLCVTGGSVFTNDDYDEDDPRHEQYVGQVLIPKGHYRARLYSLAFGVNGDGSGDVDDGQELADFLLHLDPTDGAPKTGLSELPADGWFNGTENTRKPSQRPVGLVAQDVIRPLEDMAGQWTYVWRVFEGMPQIDRRPVRGDAVSLPLDSLAKAARIAWLTSRFTVVELRLIAASGGTLDLSGDWPAGIVAVREGEVGRVFYDNDIDFNEFVDRLPAIGARLSALPDGTVLDLCSIATQPLPGVPDTVGLLSLRGVIRGGAWRIAQAYPEVAGATLHAALEFAATIEREPASGIDAFAQRFASTWPVGKLQPIEKEEEEDDGGDGMFPTKPIKGAEIFVAPSGRAYHVTMALLVSEAVAAEVQKRERGLVSAGFKHVGDLVCSAMENVAFRGYTRAGGKAWAYFRVSAPSTVTLEIASTFADVDDSSVTAGKAGENAKDVIERHEDMLEILEGEFGAPRPTAPTSRNFAETIESVLLSS